MTSLACEKAKVVICGDSGVGKTSFLRRYFNGEFTTSNTPTVGVDFYTKVVKSENCQMSLQCYDTAGQEQYRSLIRTFFTGAVAVFLCFDLTKRSSFDSLNQWLDGIYQVLPEDVTIVVIGTKLDLIQSNPEMRFISSQELREFCGDRFISWETSSKSNEGVDEAFDSLIKQLPGLIKSNKKQEIRLEAATRDNTHQGCC